MAISFNFEDTNTIPLKRNKIKAWIKSCVEKRNGELKDLNYIFCNDDYILTYKSRFGLDPELLQAGCVANEVEVPLSREGYEHLKEKVDNHMVYKTRYLVPLEKNLTAELDVFEKHLKGLMIVEVEFPSIDGASDFNPPDWFGEEISFDDRYKNAYLSTVDDIRKL